MAPYGACAVAQSTARSKAQFEAEHARAVILRCRMVGASEDLLPLLAAEFAISSCIIRRVQIEAGDGNGNPKHWQTVALLQL